jgi:hypothetical protein
MNVLFMLTQAICNNFLVRMTHFILVEKTVDKCCSKNQKPATTHKERDLEIEFANFFPSKELQSASLPLILIVWYMLQKALLNSFAARASQLLGHRA